jgi:pimeloyl-ACP methyl ester carboxylesterase
MNKSAIVAAGIFVAGAVALSVGAAGCVGSGGQPGEASPAPDAAAVATDASTADAAAPMANIDAECPVVVSDTTCDTTQRPIVFVHGTFGSGDNIANPALLFASNGYCPDRFISIDYDSLLAVGTGLTTGVFNGPLDAGSEPIDEAIDAVLAATGFSQVDIMGHSQGALQVYVYLQDPAHAAKVAHYVQLAGGPQAAPPGPPDAGGVPTLSISSQGDVIAGPIGVTGAQETVLFETQDHFAVAGSTDTFVAIWQYLHQGADGGPDGQYPQYTTIQCGDPTVTLAGKSETFGDNAVPPGGQLEVYDLTAPQEDGGTPIITFPIGDAGIIGPWTGAKRLTQYEFRGIAGDGGIIGHSYFQPFKRSDYWLRFLVPSQNQLAAYATTPVTTLDDDNESTIIARRAPGAFRSDLGDSLTVNGFQALNSQDANRQTVTVGLFMYDENKDGKSQGGSVGLYASGSVPFLRATDLFVASSPPAFVTVNLNGTVLQVPNWPSVTGGLTYVFFQ